MNTELIVQILALSIASTFISTQLVQRIKDSFKVRKWLPLAIVSFIVSFGVGFLFTISFSDLDFYMASWVGVITYAGAELIYQNFKNKLGLKSITEIEKGSDNNDNSINKNQ